MQLRSVLLFIGLGLLIACNSEDKTNSPSATEEATVTPPAPSIVFDKLVGTWKNSDGISFERWTKNSDSTYRSVAFVVKKTDTLWTEQASIYPHNGKWIFENTVKGQNDGKAIAFTSLFVNESSVQFSNPEHNFPTDINYTVTGPASVHAFIIGPNAKGGKDTIPFEYVRVK